MSHPLFYSTHCHPLLMVTNIYISTTTTTIMTNKEDLKRALSILKEDEFLPTALIAMRCQFNYYKAQEVLDYLKQKGRAESQERQRGSLTAVYWKKISTPKQMVEVEA